jgi:hypothetical protein
MITIVGFMLVSGGNLGLMLPMGLVMGLSVVLSMGGGVRRSASCQEEGLRREAGRDAPGDDRP